MSRLHSQYPLLSPSVRTTSNGMRIYPFQSNLVGLYSHLYRLRSEPTGLKPFLTGRMFVRRTYFGQFDELWFVLNWLEMRCKLRPELRRAADSMIENVKSVYFNQPSQGNSTNYYLILGPRNKAAPPTSTCKNIKKYKKKWFYNFYTAALLKNNFYSSPTLRASLSGTFLQGRMS